MHRGLHPPYGYWPTGQITAVIQYDANGNMISSNTSGSKTIIRDVENRPVSMTVNGVTTNFTYDGDGNRVKQVVVGGNTTLYINKYYEKNLTSLNATSYYYLGGTLVAMKQGSANVSYIHQDSLGGTSVVSDSNGSKVSSIAYAPFGERLESQGNLGTDKLFTGQRLDSTGLYYYGARYYDPSIGRFISPDTKIPESGNPQSYNRYSYCINNPTSAIDPSGRDYIFVGGNGQKDDKKSWYHEMNNALNVDKEKVLFIPDNDHGLWDLRAGDQYDALKRALDSGEYHDIKIIGFSEGAAATTMLLNDIATGEIGNYDQVKIAVMRETPDLGLLDFDSRERDKLPGRLTESGSKIRAVDIHNEASILSSDPGWGSDVYSYNSSTWQDYYLQAAAYE